VRELCAKRDVVGTAKAIANACDRRGGPKMKVPLLLAGLAITAATPAHAACGYLWNDRAAEAECQLNEARKAQEQLDWAAQSRRMYESYPRQDRNDLLGYMIKSREDAARRQLEDALRR
jgi:hypothetical protein